MSLVNEVFCPNSNDQNLRPLLMTYYGAKTYSLIGSLKLSFTLNMISSKFETWVSKKILNRYYTKILNRNN